MDVDRRDFEHEVRNLLRALDELVKDLRGTQEMQTYAEAINASRNALFASLVSEDSNDDRLKITQELKPLLDQVGRHDWDSPSFVDASRLIYVFQDARFSGLKDGRVTI